MENVVEVSKRSLSDNLETGETVTFSYKGELVTLTADHNVTIAGLLSSYYISLQEDRLVGEPELNDFLYHDVDLNPEVND